jgi:hypothetical protein
MASVSEKSGKNVDIILSQVKEMEDRILARLAEMEDRILAKSMEMMEVSSVAQKPAPKKQAKTTSAPAPAVSNVAVPSAPVAKKTTAKMSYVAHYKKVKDGSYPEEKCKDVIERTKKALLSGSDKIEPYDIEAKLKEIDPEYEKADDKVKRAKIVDHLMLPENKAKYTKIYQNNRDDFDVKVEEKQLNVEEHD